MKDRKNLPIIVGGWACLIVWAALLGGCAVGTATNPDGSESLIWGVDAGSVARTTNAQASAVVGELFGPTGAVIATGGLGVAGVIARLIQVATRNNERVEAEKRIRDEHNRTWPEAQAEALRLSGVRRDEGSA